MFSQKLFDRALKLHDELMAALENGEFEEYMSEHIDNGTIINIRKSESAVFGDHGRIEGWTYAGCEIMCSQSPTIVLNTNYNGQIEIFDASNRAVVAMDSDVQEAIEEYFGFGYDY